MSFGKMDNKLWKLLLDSADDCQEFEEISKKLNMRVRSTLELCKNYCYNTNKKLENNILFMIESVIDLLHDELNTGHWSEVPIYTRQCFTLANYIKCLILIKYNPVSEILMKNCLLCLDMGLLLGAPLNGNIELLTNAAKILTQEINQMQQDKISIPVSIEEQSTEDDILKSIKGTYINAIECPSVEYFGKHYFMPQQPVKLTSCMNHWPALKNWLDLNYLIQIAGNRTVPVELGSQYLDENWSQKLMPLREFISKYYLSNSGDIGYLAQHNLFDQITELKNDIHIPDYCCLSLDYDNAMEPDVNAWLGPKGTVSPLHHDPKNNILAQVYGRKQIILFSPEDTQYLYCHEDKLLNNTAQVDPYQPDLEKFPEFLKANIHKCLLEPGEMLFIPVKWWHHVTALDKSFSVSFWWQ